MLAALSPSHVFPPLRADHTIVCSEILRKTVEMLSPAKQAPLILTIPRSPIKAIVNSAQTAPSRSPQVKSPQVKAPPVHSASPAKSPQRRGRSRRRSSVKHSLSLPPEAAATRAVPTTTSSTTPGKPVAVTKPQQQQQHRISRSPVRQRARSELRAGPVTAGASPSKQPTPPSVKPTSVSPQRGRQRARSSLTASAPANLATPPSQRLSEDARQRGNIRARQYDRNSPVSKSLPDQGLRSAIAIEIELARRQAAHRSFDVHADITRKQEEELSASDRRRAEIYALNHLLRRVEKAKFKDLKAEMRIRSAVSSCHAPSGV
eukprot:TRINITY_DN15347_c0_g1_i1.p1 TRINITY_DN15347_c0_g1~~TRINITY_DN15347_c0_g1_i1.p1  ORF type:complete len:319 (+),score=44.39 TRINITY_DN15347_c0_g1_i1:81-1037(+)